MDNKVYNVKITIGNINIKFLMIADLVVLVILKNKNYQVDNVATSSHHVQP